MKKQNLLFSFVILLALCSWMTLSDATIKPAEWLLGTWENKTASGSIYETWSKLNDHELSGKSYMLRGKDTLVFEGIRLVQEGDSLYYIPTVPDQNKSRPVRFVQKTVSNDQLIFVNPRHDFPQVISYTRITKDSLVAEVSGSRRGQERKQTYHMKRVK